MEAGVGSLLFWGSLSFALVVAGAVAVPVNRWLIARGKGHAVVHETGIHGGLSPRRRHRRRRRLSSAQRCSGRSSSAARIRRADTGRWLRCPNLRAPSPVRVPQRAHALRPRHRRHGLGRHGGGRVRRDARAEGRGRRARPRRRRLPVDGLRAVQGAARVGEGGAHDRATPTTTASRPSSRRSTRRGVGADPPIQEQIAATDDNPERYQRDGRRRPLRSGPVTGAERPSASTATRTPTRYVLLCTGSRPAMPTIDGLDERRRRHERDPSSSSTSRRASIVMIGGGPIASRWPRRFTRLGMRVTILQKRPAAPAARRARARRAILDGAPARRRRRVCHATSRPTAVDGRPRRREDRARHQASASWTADELLVAVGRAPNVDGLGLEELGVEIGPRGVVVDDRAAHEREVDLRRRRRRRPLPVHALRRLRGGARRARHVLPGQEARSSTSCRGARSPTPSSRTPA